MLRWCAYCQRLIGESEPFEVFELSHGICSTCLQQHRWSSAATDAVQKLVSFHHELIELGRTGDLAQAPEALRKGLALGIKPLDFLIGLIQPALYEIGLSWEKGNVSIVEEHRFTSFASRLIDLCYQSLPQVKYPSSKAPEIILTCAPNNYHFLGLRIVEQWLISANRHVYTVFPGIPAEEILKLVVSMKPRYLGVSIAVIDQAEVLPELTDALQKVLSMSGYMPTLIVGGAIMKRREWKPSSTERITYCKEVSALDTILNSEQYAETQKGA